MMCAFDVSFRSSVNTIEYMRQKKGSKNCVKIKSGKSGKGTI